MEEDKVICPHCGQDISDLIRSEVTKRIRQINVRKALAAQRKTPEEREAQNRSSAERLQRWREKNPGQASALAAKATRSRTAETFARQAQTIKETNRRKTLKFAELVLEAKQSGRVITPEVETELLSRARDLVKAELKAERKAAKKVNSGK